MNQQNRFVKRAVVVMLALIGLTDLVASGDRTGQVVQQSQRVRYPEKLTANDKLSFGPGEEQKQTIPIHGETTLRRLGISPGRVSNPIGIVNNQ